MALRYTQQYITALVSSVGTLRYTQQYVSVMCSPTATIAEVVPQSLALTQQVQVGLNLTVHVSDNLELEDSADTNVYQVSVAQSIEFHDAVETRGAVNVTVHQSVNFAQSESGYPGVTTQRMADVLVLQQVAGRVIDVSVNQSVAFSQSGERRNTVNQSLGLSQLVKAGKGAEVDQAMGLTDVATRTVIATREIEHDLGLKQSVTFYVEQSCRHGYTLFVGSTTVAGYTTPSDTPPTLTKDTLTLTHPFDDPTTTLVLRNPEFGDKDRLGFNRINRETRGGTLIVFADPKWPKSQTLSVQVDALKQSQVSALLQFFKDSLGQEIGLLDWEGRQWRGIILTPDALVTHVSRQDRSVQFDFQGELV
jgi:hypothetical protein